MISNVQFLRAIAAILVLMAHLGGLGRSVTGAAVFEFPLGVFGVDVFFVISGFIIAHVTASDWGNPVRFFLLRAARIYPLYWIALLAYTGGPQLSAYFLQSAVLLPVLTGGGAFYPALDVGWTLIFEMFFYVVVAFSMLFGRQVLLPFVTIALLFTHLVSYFLPQGAWQVFWGHTIQFEFCIGILIWSVWQRQMIKPGVLLGLLPIAAGCFYFLPSAEPYRFLAYGAPAGYLLMCALWLEEKGFRAGRFLCYLGNASYAIYLTHPFTLMVLSPIVAALLHGLGPLIVSTFVAVLCVVVGAVVYSLVDGPLHRLARHEVKSMMAGKSRLYAFVRRS